MEVNEVKEIIETSDKEKVIKFVFNVINMFNKKFNTEFKADIEKIKLESKSSSMLSVIVRDYFSSSLYITYHLFAENDELYLTITDEEGAELFFKMMTFNQLFNIGENK